MQQKKRWTLPLALGLITALLLVLVLWPKAAPKRTIIVAARDLGAGQELTASDLVTSGVDAAQAPTDAVADPAKLVGQTLAVVRFAGEPITARHLGAAVVLAPTERGIAVKVKADTGLVGLLRPGMKVGVIATLPDQQTGDVYAKSVLEGLRVLYVSPDFVARAVAPATAATTVQSGGLTGPVNTTTGSTGTVREGVLVLAASTQAQAIRYETITDALKLTGTPVVAGVVLTPTVPLTGTVPVKAAPISAGKPGPEPVTQWVVPVELLAALNAAGNNLTLVLLPQEPRSFTTNGTLLTTVRPRTEEPTR
ncbi:MAG: Flp pilus assembly protein CpaB [Chloroflexi bacterium]|nr:Flp pilus assembly protein CpaB [Chloroflexota bacterium]